MNGKVSVNNLLNAVSIATSIINNTIQTTKILEVLNSVLRSVSELYENVLNIIFWLDRSPFDDKKEYILIREGMSVLIKEMIDCINDLNNPKFLNVPHILVEVTIFSRNILFLFN